LNHADIGLVWNCLISLDLYAQRAAQSHPAMHFSIAGLDRGTANFRRTKLRSVASRVVSFRHVGADLKQIWMWNACYQKFVAAVSGNFRGNGI
jgi:hypothetical protein